jgi:hypothetical protein
MNKTIRLFGLLILAVVFGVMSVSAQEKQPLRDRQAIEHDFIMQGHQGPTPPPHGDFVYISSEMGFHGKLVKGAPYSAQAVTESTQTLGDGNRIVRKSTAALFRDSEGRTRREQDFKAIGPLAADGPGQTIFISDPVAGVDYFLDVRNRTARKMMPMHFKFEMKTPPPGEKPDIIYERKIDRIQIEQKVARAGELKIAPEGATVMEWHGTNEKNARKESLGKQLIEGVEAEGTRTTITIPAGEIGNERAIEIVSERWYSPELQTVVMTRHSDPRFGENSYTLTNISRSEPDKSLFEIPAGYTVKEESVQPRVRMKKMEQ